MSFNLILNDVSRSVFNRICDRMKENEKAFRHSYIHYDGGAACGTLTVEAYGSDCEKSFKRAMKVVLEEYLRSF